MTIPQASNGVQMAIHRLLRSKKAQNAIGCNSVNFGRTTLKSSSFDCKFCLDSKNAIKKAEILSRLEVMAVQLVSRGANRSVYI